MVTTKLVITLVPPAYMNYLFFDKERTFKHGGFVQMSESAQEGGNDFSHERLYQEVEAEAGIFLYLSAAANKL